MFLSAVLWPSITICLRFTHTHTPTYSGRGHSQAGRLTTHQGPICLLQQQLIRNEGEKKKQRFPECFLISDNKDTGMVFDAASPKVTMRTTLSAHLPALYFNTIHWVSNELYSPFHLCSRVSLCLCVYEA